MRLSSALFLFPLFLCSLWLRADEPAVQAPLRTIPQILALNESEAARQVPIDITGVIVAKSASLVFFLCDGTDSICLYLSLQSNFRQNLVQGKRIRVIGTSAPGKFAPVISGIIAEDLGMAEIPLARKVSINQLEMVGLDGQWIEVQGIVRRAVKSSSGGASLELASGKERLPVQIQEIPPQDLEELVDSQVAFQGICLHNFNSKGQFFETRLLCPTAAWTILRRGRLPDALPVSKTAALLRYSRSGVDAHRIRVSGVVTYVDSAGWLCLQDDTGALRMRFSGPAPVVGNLIDAAGFVAAEGLSPLLEDSVFTVLATHANLSPIETAINDLPDHDAYLIRIDGLLQSNLSAKGHRRLTLDTDGGPLSFQLDDPAENAFLRDLPLGSRLRVTGVCEAKANALDPNAQRWRPSGITILGRSAADVQVLQRPPFKFSNILLPLACLLISAAFIFLGYKLLVTRRRLLEQKRQRAQAESVFSAVLKERNRLAREIHDTVAQGLTGVSVHIELARASLQKPPVDQAFVSKHLDLAKGFVREGLGELRRTIQGLRPQILEQHNLVVALRKTGEQLTAATSIQFSMTAEGALPVLAPSLESDLLSIAQEAMTNALRHSGASLIHLEISFRDSMVLLLIRDNGCGIPPSLTSPGATLNASAPASGFGLAGIRERVAAYQGKVSISGTPGGTTLQLRLPLK